MRVLLTGASGFIGKHVAAELERHGHAVVCAVRAEAYAPEGCEGTVETDFTRDLAPSRWLAKLERIDAVINMVGILRAGGTSARLFTMFASMP
jgi:nucleoside-diphosphate-sugar epimerase